MGELVRLVSTFRACWLSGRPGGGKTLLSVVLALELLRQGLCTRIVANVPLHVEGLSWTPTETPSECVDACIILDEAWSELGMGQDKALKQWLAYPRKRNQYLLFPSVLPLVRSLGTFRVQRVFNGSQLGIPLWVYRYRIELGEKKPMTGFVPLVNPSAWFSVYDSFSLPIGWRVYEFDK